MSRGMVKAAHGEVPTGRGALLIGHGSRDQAGNAQFLDLAARLGVEPGFLGHASPTIQDGIDRLAERGITEVEVVPLFLFAAGHAKRDVPAQLALGARRHPGLTFRCGPVLGVDPTLVKIAAALAGPGHDDTVLLIGRGSSDEEANEGLREVARLLQAQTGCQAVHAVYCDVAAPSVEEGLARCVAGSARRVNVLPYFLFKGVLMRRLQALTAVWQERHPQVRFRFAGADGLAAHPALAELLHARIAEMVSNPSVASFVLDDVPLC